LDDLNDPFEFKSVNLCNPRHAQAFDGFIPQMAERFGVLCFSKDKTDVLLWAHYGDRHKGISLGFDVSGSEGKFGRVHYVSKRLPFPQLLDEAFMWKLLSTKSKAWEYEREWRVFTELKERIWNEAANRFLYFAHCGSELVLREVILGAANKNTVNEVHDAIQGSGEHVSVARMHLSCNAFSLEEVTADIAATASRKCER
jgi:Protein of unknown function (DUF2971)